jgi:hypothetical protein
MVRSSTSHACLICKKNCQCINESKKPRLASHLSHLITLSLQKVVFNLFTKHLAEWLSIFGLWGRLFLDLPSYCKSSCHMGGSSRWNPSLGRCLWFVQSIGYFSAHKTLICISLVHLTLCQIDKVWPHCTVAYKFNTCTCFFCTLEYITHAPSYRPLSSNSQSFGSL